jgi:ferredoxin
MKYTLVVEDEDGRVLERVDTEDVRLLDACDEAALSISTACRGGDCGTCMVEVSEGHDLVEPATTEEVATLARWGGSPASRLACQLRAAKSGIIRLRVRLRSN